MALQTRRKARDNIPGHLQSIRTERAVCPRLSFRLESRRAHVELNKNIDSRGLHLQKLSPTTVKGSLTWKPLSECSGSCVVRCCIAFLCPLISHIGPWALMQMHFMETAYPT